MRFCKRDKFCVQRGDGLRSRRDRLGGADARAGSHVDLVAGQRDERAGRPRALLDVRDRRHAGRSDGVLDIVGVVHDAAIGRQDDEDRARAVALRVLDRALDAMCHAGVDRVIDIDDLDEARVTRILNRRTGEADARKPGREDQAEEHRSGFHLALLFQEATDCFLDGFSIGLVPQLRHSRLHRVGERRIRAEAGSTLWRRHRAVAPRRAAPGDMRGGWCVRAFPCRRDRSDRLS